MDSQSRENEVKVHWSGHVDNGKDCYMCGILTRHLEYACVVDVAQLADGPLTVRPVVL